MCFTAAALAATLAIGDAAAQTGTGTVRGRVTHGGSGTPLGNVQLSISGTRLGVQSRDDGTFQINGVPAGAQHLQAHLIGYAAVEKPVTVAAGQTATVDVTLNQTAVSLDEVVVTGTAGQARRREVGNSISAVNAADAPGAKTDLSSLLQGRVAGASVQLSGGSSGAGSSIRLRGISSVSLSNQPLVYIDGVRVRSDEYPKNMPAGGASPNLRGPNVYASPLNDIDPSDIERIEIIKGAAATTLYGTEAAAGVIQVFTKKGSAGGASWNFQTTQGFNRERPFGIDDSKYSASPTFTPSGDCSKSNECSDYLFINPWLRDGRRQAYLLSVNGGTQSGLRYFVSGNFDDNQGVLPLDDERKITARGNFSFQPTPALTIEWDAGFTNDSIRNTPAGNNAAGITLNAFRRNRNYFGSANIDTIGQVLSYQLNTWISHLTMGTTMTWAPLTGFSNKVTVGLDRSELENRNLRPYGFVSLPQGGLSDQHWTSQLVSGDYTGNFEHDLNLGGLGLHTTSSWGGQMTTNDLRDLQSYTEGFPGPGVPTVSSGSQWNGIENRTRIVTGGLFLQEIVGWRDRLFVTGGIRFDKYSAFGSNLGLQHYPKISASYVVSDEDFFPKKIGTLKLRAAYGQAGRAPGAFDALRTYLPVGWGGQAAFRTNTVGDPDLGPERSAETEVGFDATTLGDRLSIEATYYNTKTTDALLPVRQVPSLGFITSQLENVGKLQRSGLEVQMSGDVFRSRPVTWNAGLSLALNSSKALSLGGAPPFQIANYGWIYEGRPVADIRGRKVTNPDEIAAPNIVEDYDYGPSQPTHIIGLNSTLSFPHGIQLSARGEYQGGFYINEDASYEAISRGVQWPTCFAAYSLQSTATDESKWTARQRAYCDPTQARPDLFIFKGDFFKLRDITLLAPIPTRFVPRSSHAQLSVSVQNWYRWQNSDMRIFDPEMAGNDGFNATVRYISEQIPAPATVLMQLRFSF
jgi:TonB-dependent SusC/RagA subfamily outer membrane receptor